MISIYGESYVVRGVLYWLDPETTVAYVCCGPRWARVGAMPLGAQFIGFTTSPL